MRKYPFFSLAVLAFPLSIFSFLTNSTQKQIKLTCEVTNCQKIDSLYLYEFNGINFNKIQAALVTTDEVVFTLPQSEPRFYYMGLNTNDLRPIILGTEDQVNMSSQCVGFRQAKTELSDLNKNYENLKIEMQNFNQELNQLANEFRSKLQDENGIKEMHTKYKALDQKQRDFFNNLKKENKYLSKVFSLNCYLSYQANSDGYPNEIEYFANQYFQLVDWNDSDLNYMPWVYESMKNYVTTLSQINLSSTQHKDYITNTLSRIPKNMRSFQLAMGGTLAALEAKNHENYKYFGEMFIENLGEKMPLEAAEIRKKIERMSAMVVGGEAPDFMLAQPDGTPLSLSSFRGKIVLIDFWASWCGPCRAENPKVLKLYEKYKEKGFDVLGVSLDNDKGRWKQAIEKDGLVWNHVSDLKKWSNEAAKLYGVRSIPHTVLLDQNGRIIARGLRAHQLEQELIKIFGE